MASFDDFIHVSTGPTAGPQASSSADYGVPSDYFDNAKGKRWSTEAMMVDTIRQNHPKHHLTVAPTYSVNLLAFGDASPYVTYFPQNPANIMALRQYLPPARRYNDENGGSFLEQIQFGCYDFVFKGQQFIVYIAYGSEGGMMTKAFNYILVEDLNMEGNAIAQKKTDELMAAAGQWAQELHNEVLVFDQGFWQKNKELWQNIQKSEWEDVILDKGKKEAIIDDVIGFFNSQKKYDEFNVPWKRGVILYGPPGNGKTISTKALMHDISKRKDPSVECLYVKTFNSFMGPEAGIRNIFLMARRMAPCILIFEDIDSLVNVAVRSYFLNEVDGLESNHGILMIGSTNHLEKLDPGIAKRPSRFDRKYLFDVPNRDERVQYAEYWRHKLRNNKKVDFPKEMSARVADITGEFSFAYMKEAFVAALLVLAAKNDEEQYMSNWEDPLSVNVLWKEIKRQVENLRKEMDEETDVSSSLNVMSGMWPALSSSILDEKTPRTRPMEIRQSAMPRYI